jgi:hypothetical protein
MSSVVMARVSIKTLLLTLLLMCLLAEKGKHKIKNYIHADITPTSSTNKDVFMELYVRQILLK